MMRYDEKTQEKMEKGDDEMSNKINDYNLNTLKNNTGSIFPYDPYIKYNNSGLFRNSDGAFMDKNSDILNITRPLSNNPVDKIPVPLDNENLQLRDGLFQTKNTLLDSPPMELRGQTKNRWIELPQNPQENVIEPFKRLGTNTYLTLIDHYDC